MKPNVEQLKVEGSLPGTGRRMDFDPESIAHIMRLLIDLYSDKELAVLRELSTNAIDSHIMAGITRPIEVQTPTPLSPYLIIRDYGLGLAVEEIYDLFGRYGASTKRGTNDATGMLGLGSKSPLTYTNQFTMTAIKEGVRAVVAITRQEDGVGSLTVVDTASTDAGNGVEIKIPAKSQNAFEAKAKTFFSYWKAGTVLLNGSDPSGLPADAVEVTPTIHLVKGTYTYRYGTDTTNSVVVMGNVPYPAPELGARELGIPDGHYIIAYVPIGAVDFAPSREGLQDSKRTRAAIDQIKADFRAGIKDAVQREVDKALTGLQAMKIVRSWTSLYRGGGGQMPDFTYKGKTVPLEIKVPSEKKEVTDRWGYKSNVSTPTQKMILSDTYNYATRRKQATQHVPSINFDLMISAVFVTGFDQADATLSLRKKANQWLNDTSNLNRADIRYFVWIDWLPAELDFIDPDHIVDFQTIKDEVLPKESSASSSGRIPGSFDLLLGGKDNEAYNRPTGVPGDQIDQKHPVYYIHGNQNSAYYEYLPILNAFHKRYTIICLPENRLAKFKRENPGIKNARDEVRELSKQAAAKMTQEQKDALAQYDARDRHKFEALAAYAGVIDDPAIKNAIKLAQINIDGLLKMRERFRGTVSFASTDWKDPLYPYELAPGYSMKSVNIPHLVRYLNNEYAFQQSLTAASSSGTLQP